MGGRGPYDAESAPDSGNNAEEAGDSKENVERCGCAKSGFTRNGKSDRTILVSFCHWRRRANGPMRRRTRGGR